MDVVVDWSDLPPELIDNIARKLDSYVDYIRFRAVCRLWHSSLSPTPHRLPCQFPWLMLTPGESNNYQQRHGFFNFSENRVFLLNMPSTNQPWRRCCGSSHGWLALLQEHDPVIVLFNPFTRNQIQLPPITAFPIVLDFDIGQVGKEYRLQSSWERLSLEHVRDLFIRKIVLSTSPDSPHEDFVALAIVDLGWKLAYWKKGEEKWKFIKGAEFYEDVVYYKGLFWAVHHNGSIAIVNFSGPSPCIDVINHSAPIYRPDMSFGYTLYLVDEFGELLMVQRLFRPVRAIDRRFMVYDTTGFNVFRLNASQTEWDRVRSLGDRMLFLGTSSSLCLSASGFNGFDGNNIYFTGEIARPSYLSYYNYDSGIFNLGFGDINKLPSCAYRQNTYSSPPVWLTPNL